MCLEPVSWQLALIGPLPGRGLFLFSLTNISLSRKRNLDLQGCDEGVCVCTKSTAKTVQKAGQLKTSEEIFILDTHSMISILEAGILQHLE